MGKITLQDIADDTGFSVSTVSRVLNGSDKISAATIEKVSSSARKLNYNAGEKLNGHNSPKTLSIALVISRFHRGEFYASFCDGFIAAADKKNVILSMVCTNKSKKALHSYIPQVCRHADGLILYTPEFNRNDYGKLQRNLPAEFPVISNGLIENPVFPTITFDGYRGGFMAAKHFYDNGYFSCGVIKGPAEKAEARNRAHGFRDFIGRHTNMNLDWQHGGNFTFESGLQAFESYQASPRKPRAIFGCNDVMCHGFMEAATEIGYTFPDDIAIIGFDDLPICTRHMPTISSISTSYEKLGRSTLNAITNMITHSANQDGMGMLSLLPVTLSQRTSS